MKFTISTLSLLALPLVSATPTPLTSQWRQLADFAAGPIQENSVTSLHDKIYSLGGVLMTANSTSDPTTDVVQSYSVKSNKWYNETSLPLPLNHLNVASVGGKMYVLGGLTIGPGQWPNWIAVDTSWVYDPSSKRWSSLPASPGGTRRGSSAVGVYKDTIYLAGGLETLSGSAYISVDTVTAYNTKTKQWNFLPPLPTVLDHSGGAIIEDTFYVVGGRVNGSAHGVGNIGTVFALDVTSRHPRWVERKPMPTARSGFSLAVVGKKIYTFGGEGDRSNPDTYVFDDVEVFDTVKGTWKILPKWPVPRHGTGAASIGGRIYIPGGGLVTQFGPTARFDVFSP